MSRRDPHPVIVHLRACRVACGRSQEAIARRIGVTRRAVVCWETGRYAPGLDLLAAYAQALGYDLTLTPRQETDADV